MNLYREIHGENPLASVLLHALGATREHFARYRDVFLNADGTRILVLCHCGGGNREEYAEWYDALRTAPTYESDRDDPFDTTFAWITFRVPPQHLERLQKLATGQEPPDLKRMHDMAFAELSGFPREQLMARLPGLTEALNAILDLAASEERDEGIQFD
jgi:hypothetical protein